MTVKEPFETYGVSTLIFFFKGTGEREMFVVGQYKRTDDVKEETRNGGWIKKRLKQGLLVDSSLSELAILGVDFFSILFVALFYCQYSNISRKKNMMERNA